MRTDRHFEFLDLSNKEVKPSFPFIKSPYVLELKILPSHLNIFILVFLSW